ncbi:MAG: hypothetical protein GXO55_10125, partial [Chloroflexi bacterium]|nr:hypothetical protein [Chloroflexota bacterium]
MSELHPSPLKRVFSMWTRVEMPIYLGVGITLLVAAFAALGEIWAYQIIPWIRGRIALDVLVVLDKLLLISMLAEILQMVKISMTQRRLSSEPFLIVGLISVVRRILIITAEGTHIVNQASLQHFHALLVELAILALLLFAFVKGLYILRQQRLDESRR